MIQLTSETNEKLEATVESATDPTTYSNEWAFPPVNTDPSTWIAGAWDGAAVQVGSKWQRKALTPTIGTSPDLSDGTYDVYCRIIAGSEQPIVKLDDTLVIV
jgi:hypothetical protein